MVSVKYYMLVASIFIHKKYANSLFLMMPKFFFVSQKCNLEFEKYELNLGGLKPKPVAPQPPKPKALYRTFSKDITFERSISRQEVRNVESRASKFMPEVTQLKKAWYIKVNFFRIRLIDIQFLKLQNAMNPNKQTESG